MPLAAGVGMLCVLFVDRATPGRTRGGGPQRSRIVDRAGPGTAPLPPPRARSNPGPPSAQAGRRHPRADAPSARWARAGDIKVLSCPPGAPGRLVLGRPLAAGGRTGRSGSRRPVIAAERAQSVAVVGPTLSGKTTGLAVPAILEWQGPVVAASVKTDLLRDTLAWRRRCGHVWCFDPAASTGLPADRWSPLPAAATWAGALRAAADLTAVARVEGTSADGEFWYATASKLLAPLLFAASRGGRQMSDVVRWVDTQEVVEVADLLEDSGVPEALQAARASWQRDERQRSSVYTTAETVLEPIAQAEAASSSTSGHDIDADALLDGAHTLYVCAPAHDQRRLRGLFTVVIKQVLDAAFARSARLGRALDPPLLVVLDEAANIAPLAELDGLAATCAGHGVQLVTIWQDLAQVGARYGARAATVVNNHRARLFLSGIADSGTLDYASHLVGDEQLTMPTVTLDPMGGRSTTATPLQRRLLPPDALRRMPEGTGVLVYGALPPLRLALRPWWKDPVLARRGGSGPGRVAETRGI
jgi:type IV secretion system protein VirD4